MFRVSLILLLTAMTGLAATAYQDLAVVGDDQVWTTVDLGATWQDAGFNLGSQKGTHEAMIDLFMRGDLFMSRLDNEVVVPLDVTPGSLAWICALSPS